MVTKGVLTKECKRCGKKFYSLYQKQLDYNFQAHELACKKKKGDRGDNKK
jgi:hypothetical protein